MFWPFNKKKKQPKSPIVEGISVQPTPIPETVPDEKPEYEDGYKKEYPAFTAKVIEKIDNGKGYWNYLDIGVYQQDAKGQEPYLIGQYRRNYSSFGNTFAPTRKGDKYYALYSPDYTGTRVLEITPGVGIKDIGGEVRDGSGFCPIDLYIPTLREYVSEDHRCGGVHDKVKDWSKLLSYFPPGSRADVSKSSMKGRKKIEYPDGKDVRAYTGKKNTYDDKEAYRWVWGPEREYEHGFVTLPPLHGFVAGCHWGDDSSWKIQYIDVSRIDEGIIKREDRFGYIELPTHLDLKKAIHIDDVDDGGRLKISVELEFDINTGGLIDWNGLAEQIKKGATVVEENDKNWKDFRLTHDELDAEMKRRWYGEEGEAIRKWVKENGGKFD